ncbi:BZ3500_MvSof-1268-A1-R1_Chr12-1g03671 [Microbotryum saponariae]|uniref:BZ3500_MvSof-1268-A1-R1_Chr12-1g03671 protein n=1 Tax=Microbotryum saponariae TaxID=289078 RepID=A0A2X0LE80_9BASI|nr:BZ3500_MvSof-1268-A1-R1_Chr12-1g03671 [Microbotryum saponariae]SDA05264.1 BZ3501_MvSof-1269-A2-R1_Chr12-1g03248 [Microbotryum saponariae]
MAPPHDGATSSSRRRPQTSRNLRSSASQTKTLMTLLAVSSTLMVQAQNAVYPQPTDIAGTGPKPPAVQSPAIGTWATPSAPVTDGNGVHVPPASETGLGRQAHVRSPTDFCLFMPPDPVTENLVDAEADAVAYCFNAVNGTRPMPDGFVQTAHFRKTADYVQVSGTYDWRKMNLNPYDCGGEYDNHGPSGKGNPVGAAIDGGQDFFQFLGSCDTVGVGQFVIRSCFGSRSYPYCRNTFDLMGSLWVAPGEYREPGFTSCSADSDLPVGVYNSSYTFAQGDPYTPPAVTAPSSSMCSTTASPSASGVTYAWAQFGYQQAISGGAASPTATGSASATTDSVAVASSTITSAPTVSAAASTTTRPAVATPTSSTSGARHLVAAGSALGMVFLLLVMAFVA